MPIALKRNHRCDRAASIITKENEHRTESSDCGSVGSGATAQFQGDLSSIALLGSKTIGSSENSAKWLQFLERLEFSRTTGQFIIRR
jgi:hypothetical protein